ncbi:hypothetical protein KIW84_034559 [Lathyrus oleraceus]|uniref:Uncharacterized protein n=1 Tax=Pisum sativum TaxID=3888 RepID=A0A9D4Y1J5_PEA|nr:hypothetical protein KIW84_034559 [Pisum sativum]
MMCFNEGVDGEAKDGENPSESSNTKFIIQDMGREHVIKEEYINDELDSEADDDSCDDRPSDKDIVSQAQSSKTIRQKSAKAKWVAKVTVNGLKNNTKIKLNEVVVDMRLRYTTEIAGCRAFKERQLARQIVEGHSRKQFNFLWSYGAE